jgi:hypothetical protein
VPSAILRHPLLRHTECATTIKDGQSASECQSYMDPSPIANLARMHYIAGLFSAGKSGPTSTLRAYVVFFFLPWAARTKLDNIRTF